MRRLPSLREAARSFAVLVAVSSLAIAQPLLDVFGRSPETFVFAGGGGATIVAFGLLVILLVLDELPRSTLLGPDGRIDAEVFPNFAALAGESTWYRNATTTQALTLRAVPAVLTGQDIGLERLRASGLYDDAVVAVTADHGANFSTGAVYRGPDDTTYEQIMWVPMMIKAPGQTEGVIDDANVTNLDVLPTIAALAGIDVPFAVDGVAADGAGGRDGTKRFYRSHQPPYLPDPEAVLEYDMDEGGQKARDRIYPSVRRGDPSWWPYQVGEHADLIGVPVQSLTVGSPDDRSVTLDPGQSEALAEVDLEDQLRPVFLSGVVDLAVTDDVVVAVNGRVAGVSPVFENFAAETRMAVLVPEMLLGRTNELELFSIAGDGTGEVVVRPLQT